jgi:hypothetical protein
MNKHQDKIKKVEKIKKDFFKKMEDVRFECDKKISEIKSKQNLEKIRKSIK